MISQHSLRPESTPDVSQLQSRTHSEVTSSSSPKTLKIASDTPRERILAREEPYRESRGSLEALPGNGEPANIALSHSGISLQPSGDALTDSEEHHTSPLDELLSPTTTPAAQSQSFVRDSVVGSDFGEVRLDDESRFSTVS